MKHASSFIDCCLLINGFTWSMVLKLLLPSVDMCTCFPYLQLLILEALKFHNKLQ